MIVPGMGAATRTLLLQWPQLIEHVPEIQNCFQGTLNVHLSLPVLIINPERSVPPFEWEPNHTEGFGFVRIRFECPINAEPVPGWVYLAQHSQHRYNLHSLEVITTLIPGLRNRANIAGQYPQCKVHFSSAAGVII